MITRSANKLSTWLLAPLLAGALAFAGCDSCSTKPSTEECEKAIENVRRIRSLEGADVGADPRAAVRSCRGNSNKETVRCFVAARTEEDLRACEGAVGEKYLEQEREIQRKRQEELEKKQAAQPDAGAAGEGSDD
jgi:hypothetical protein